MSNHLIRGLLDLRSISITPPEQNCTTAGREPASKCRNDDLTDWCSICTVGESSGRGSVAHSFFRAGQSLGVRDVDLCLVLADKLHERGVNPRHKGGDGFPGVMGGPIASLAHLELDISRC